MAPKPGGDGQDLRADRSDRVPVTSLKNGFPQPVRQAKDKVVIDANETER